MNAHLVLWSLLLVTLSGKTLTMNEDHGLLVSELLDKIAFLSALPTSTFYVKRIPPDTAIHEQKWLRKSV